MKNKKEKPHILVSGEWNPKTGKVKFDKEKSPKIEDKDLVWKIIDILKSEGLDLMTGDIEKQTEDPVVKKMLRLFAQEKQKYRQEILGKQKAVHPQRFRCSDKEFEEILRKKEAHYELREKLVIKQVRQDLKEDLLKRIEEKKKKLILRGGDGKEFDGEKSGLSLGSINKGYNQALQEIKELIKKI